MKKHKGIVTIEQDRKKICVFPKLERDFKRL